MVPRDYTKIACSLVVNCLFIIECRYNVYSNTMDSVSLTELDEIRHHSNYVAEEN